MTKVRNKLLEKIKSNSTIKDAALITESRTFLEKEFIPTFVPMLNVACSGDIDGGFTPGLTMFAGPSKHFKTLFTLILAKAYLDKHEDAMMILYDSEFGSPLSYFTSLDIDPERVLHCPILDIEELKFDIINQLEKLERGDKLIIVVDSIGNLASVKEVEDAINQKSVADMSRAKALKSFFRIAAPRCTMKDLPLLVVNHTYKEIALFPKDIVSGGTGSYYNSDSIFILGRQQETEGTGVNKEVTGWNYVINVEKSRYVKEKSKIIIKVEFDGGVDVNSGILDLAVEFGYVEKLAKGYAYKGERYSEKKMDDAFFANFLNDSEFKQKVKEKYQLAQKDLL